MLRALFPSLFHPSPRRIKAEIQSREQEISKLMALKLEQDANSLVVEGVTQQDPIKLQDALKLFARAREIRQGEASLLSAMGLLRADTSDKT